MSGISLDELQFDPSAISDSQRVGAFLISAGGTLITDTGGALDVNVGNTVTVSATDLDIRDLAFATDSVDVSGSSVTVSGTDIDIRDLVNTQDSIAIGDEVNIIDLQQMDAAFGATSFGVGIYGIRQDAGGSPVSADGDAHPLVFNDDGELKVAADLTSNVADDAVDSGNPIKIGGQAYATSAALAALSASGDRFHLLGDLYRRLFVNDAHNVAHQVTAESVAATAGEVVSSPLAGRKEVIIQNLGSQPVYVGNSASVTAANGIRIPKNASMSFRYGEAIDIFMISASGTQDVRVLEAA